MKIQTQEAAIGKALWHQVTTVVILRENMRQKRQSPEDAKLRTALENMRYKACTQEDITFLEDITLSHGLPGTPLGVPGESLSPALGLHGYCSGSVLGVPYSTAVIQVHSLGTPLGLPGDSLQTPLGLPWDSGTGLGVPRQDLSGSQPGLPVDSLVIFNLTLNIFIYIIILKKKWRQRDSNPDLPVSDATNEAP